MYRYIYVLCHMYIYFKTIESIENWVIDFSGKETEMDR